MDNDIVSKQGQVNAGDTGVSDKIAIGVSSSEIRVPAHLKAIPEGEPPHREICLGMPYLHAIEQVGAVPLIIAPLSRDGIDEMLDRVDGVCLSGGPDLDPKTYGRPPHPNLGPTEYAVDSFEIALAQAADRRGMPVLAICRGAQVVNIARGGTLFQHIPEDPGASLDHRQEELGRYTTHEVSVLQDTLLHETLGCSNLPVNSFHHQAVDALGTNLRASAHSADGIIEGIEAVDRDFLLGVQWHAESLTDAAPQESLFRGLIEAAERFRRAPDTRRVRAV